MRSRMPKLSDPAEIVEFSHIDHGDVLVPKVYVSQFMVGDSVFTHSFDTRGMPAPFKTADSRWISAIEFMKQYDLDLANMEEFS